MSSDGIDTVGHTSEHRSHSPRVSHESAQQATVPRALDGPRVAYDEQVLSGTRESDVDSMARGEEADVATKIGADCRHDDDVTLAPLRW